MEKKRPSHLFLLLFFCSGSDHIKKAGGDCAQLRTWAKWRIAERHGEKRRGGAGDGAGAGVRRLWLVDVACGL